MRIEMAKFALLAAVVALAAPAGVRGADTGSGAGGGTLSEELREGLQKLHAANQAEVKGGQLAQQAAASADVKAFGRQMVTDHGKNDAQLTALAKSLGVNLKGPAYEEKQQEVKDAMKDVQGKTGRAFDRAYTDLMVEDHRKEAEEVKELAEKAREDGQAQLATFLSSTEQTMQGHLAHVQQLREASRQAAASAGTGSGAEDGGTGQGAGDTGQDSPAEQSAGGSSAGDYAP